MQICTAKPLNVVAKKDVPMIDYNFPCFTQPMGTVGSISLESPLKCHTQRRSGMHGCVGGRTEGRHTEDRAA